MTNYSHPIRKATGFTVTAVLLLLLPAACRKQDATADNGLHPMPLAQPANFPPLIYDVSSNPITREGFELGRRLFYDGRLSRDGSTSCGSCHQQANAFTHHGHDVSHGIDDRVGTRNSPPIMNLGWSRFFFWDGGVFHLDLQPVAPIENPVEMDEKLPNVINKLNADAGYRAQFKQVFGTETINAARMLQALSQFMLHCVSTNSRYDQYKRNEGGILTATELAGMQIFEQRCTNCHTTGLFTDNSFHNNGLPPTAVQDMGRYNVTLNPADAWLFKTPSLRNIALTAPYMHDGRFYTLEAVLDHYSNGVQASTTLDTLLKRNGVLGIPLTATEKSQVIAFLKTLSDDTFTRDPKLSE